MGFYTNWFMAEVAFFTTPPASQLLQFLDRSLRIYTDRTGDLTIQSTVVRLFLPPEQISWVRDFTYEHTTVSGAGPQRGCLQNGGMSRGRGAHTDAEWAAIVRAFRARFAHNPACGPRPALELEDFIGAADVGICSNQHHGPCADALQAYLQAMLPAENISLAAPEPSAPDSDSARKDKLEGKKAVEGGEDKAKAGDHNDKDQAQAESAIVVHGEDKTAGNKAL